MKTWDDAAAAWLVDRYYKRSLYQDRAILKWLQPHFGGLSLDQIDRDRIMAAARLKAADSSPATANRHLALIRSILRRAMHVWRWLDSVPHVELFPEAGRRIRWLTPDQARRLVGLLPLHHQHMVVFALATGLRQANVLKLQWDQVDMPRRLLWVHAEQAKGKRTFSIPLCDTAMDVLRACKGQHAHRVFTFRGKPLAAANTKVWRRALVQAGIHDFRWHDLRHTWASWHVQHGTPLFVVQDLGAWSGEQMVRRYAHLAPSQYAEHALAIDGFLQDV